MAKKFPRTCAGQVISRKKKKRKDEVHISISPPKYYYYLMHDTGFVAYASLARFALEYLRIPFRPMAP